MCTYVAMITELTTLRNIVNLLRMIRMCTYVAMFTELHNTEEHC